MQAEALRVSLNLVAIIYFAVFTVVQAHRVCLYWILMEMFCKRMRTLNYLFSSQLISKRGILVIFILFQVILTEFAIQPLAYFR